MVLVNGADAVAALAGRAVANGEDLVDRTGGSGIDVFNRRSGIVTS